ncbi:hypothetical protein [Fimbriimonas ginsengisoli]|uniref:Uncharacterized protein n=1 Tax=Fimbriimonas ginsengisoli Gsoil 348 TaxID=661478 RepID=A0A068NXY5_FIMGI|nr:hypothetical protein [Fimbriimonas ginsengisoli]AIE87675.1 hypothetical protein OP10G_4307 [Fimbriimonas ginsengisoli Gsoil 348]
MSSIFVILPVQTLQIGKAQYELVAEIDNKKVLYGRGFTGLCSNW